jgi:hypothetical protein
MPPPDLGMIESVGSMENSSKYGETTKSIHIPNINNTEESKNNHSCSSNHSKASKFSKEHPLESLRSINSSQDSISGIKGDSPKDINTIPGSANTEK